MATTDTSPTCADAIVGTLTAHGIYQIFCLPGVQNDAFFNALYDAGNRIRPIHTRHEQAAAYMALGAALSTGKPAVYSVVPGPGLLNTFAALATAYSTNAPVLCLTGQIASKMIDKGIGVLHEIPNQIGMLKTLTKWADRVSEPQNGAAKTAEAFQQMLSGRWRPVGLEIPPDILFGKSPVSHAEPLALIPDAPIDEDAIAKAAKLLGDAKNPIICVGGGALDASAEVKALAERLQAPVVAYRMGRGTLDERHLLAHTLTAGNHFWKSADVVLAVGTRSQARQMVWGTDADMKVIQIDIDTAEFERSPKPYMGIQGRAAAVLTKLSNALEKTGVKRPSRDDEMKEVKARVARQWQEVQPQQGLLQALREALPENGIMVDELTQVGYASRAAWPVYEPRSFVSSGYQGTLGWGFCAALGVKAARPDRPVVSITGDGGFLFGANEMATAVQHNLATITVLFNDGAYGNVQRAQVKDYGNRVIATELKNPNFMKFAESFGAMGIKANGPAELKSAVQKALKAEVPALIEVPCEPMPSPWKLIDPGKVRG